VFLCRDESAVDSDTGIPQNRFSCVLGVEPHLDRRIPWVFVGGGETKGMVKGDGMRFLAVFETTRIVEKHYKTRKTPPRGLEPLTFALGKRCSIQLSYGG
jgi:hypothetical protein